MAETIWQGSLGQYRGVVSYHENGEGVRIAQRCFLEELPGIVFGAMTLIWICSSLAGLMWRELPTEITQRLPELVMSLWASHSLVAARHIASVAAVAGRVHTVMADTHS